MKWPLPIMMIRAGVSTVNLSRRNSMPKLEFYLKRMVLWCSIPMRPGYPSKPGLPHAACNLPLAKCHPRISGNWLRFFGELCMDLNNPHFNFVIHSAPVGDHQQDYYLWHIQILPRLTTIAGFELGSGIFINTMLPEEAATFLRKYCS